MIELNKAFNESYNKTIMFKYLTLTKINNKQNVNSNIFGFEGSTLNNENASYLVFWCPFLLMVYSIDSKESFDKIKKWFEDKNQSNEINSFLINN